MSRVIVIDPGHGGSDPGAIGPTGLKEKDVTLAVSKKLAAYLCDMADVHLTRWTDKELGPDVNSDLAARANLANSLKADLFISVHCNSAADPSAHGVETYALAPGGEGEKIARLVQASLVETTNLADRGVKFANYYVLRKTAMPAILVELAFISNPQEEAMLANPDFQDVCARAIAAGVKRFYGISTTSQEAVQVAEKWQEDIMAWGRANLNLSDQHKADEAAPKWFVVAVVQRGIELAVKKALEAAKNA